jgi:hypothetical protein
MQGLEPRTDQAGKDTRYDGGEQPPRARFRGSGVRRHGEDFKKKNYLEYQFARRRGEPVANEDYRVELPDGTSKPARLRPGPRRFEPVQDGGVGNIQFPTERW